jgi:hypothetical protein
MLLDPVLAVAHATGKADGQATSAAALSAGAPHITAERLRTIDRPVQEAKCTQNPREKGRRTAGRSGDWNTLEENASRM